MLLNLSVGTHEGGQWHGVVALIGRNIRSQRVAPVASCRAVRAALGFIQAGSAVVNKAGLAEHTFCMSYEAAVVGTVQHRLWTCPALNSTQTARKKLVEVRNGG